MALEVVRNGQYFNGRHGNYENEVVLNLRKLCHLWIDCSEIELSLKSIRRCRRWALMDGDLVHRFLPSGGFTQLRTLEL